MRVLGTSVLVFEWLVFALAVPVAINVAGVSPAMALLLLAAVTVLVVVAIRMLPGRTGIALGWVVQAVALLSGFLMVAMTILGVIFTGLWYLAVRLGTQADAQKAAAAAAEASAAAAPGPAGAAGVSDAAGATGTTGAAGAGPAA